MFQMFRECGSAALFGALLAMIALLMGLVALALWFAKKLGAARGLAIATLGVAFAIAALGPAGRSWQRAIIDGAVSGDSVLPDMRQRILTEGYREADGCIPVLLGLAALPCLLGVVVLLGVRSTRRRLATV